MMGPGTELTRFDPEWPIRLGAITDDTFALHIPIGGRVIALAIPYALVLGWWLTVDLQLSLRLDGRAVLRGQRLLFEPYDQRQ